MPCLPNGTHPLPPLKGEVARIARRRGQPRYAECHFECTKANSYNPPLPPLGVVLRAANQDSNDCRWQSYLCFVPRSGKGGAVGIFEPLPFNEPHPLSQAVRPASSPIGEPSEGDTNSPKFHKTASTCRETPLRLAKSRLAAVARLHGACGRTSQALWACQLSFA